LFRVGVPSGNFLEILGVGKYLIPLFLVLIQLGGRWASKVVSCSSKTITLHRLLGIGVPPRDFLELICVGQDAQAFFYHLLIVFWGGRPREEVAPSGSGIHRNRFLGMHVPLRDPEQLRGIGKNLFPLFLVLIKFGSIGAGKVVASVGCSVDYNFFLRVSVPIGNHLELVDLSKDELTFFNIINFLLFWGGRTTKVVTSEYSGIHSNRLLWLEVPARSFLQPTCLFKDKLPFCFHFFGVVGFEVEGELLSLGGTFPGQTSSIIIECRRTREKVSSTSGRISSDRLLRVHVPFSSHLEYFHVFHDAFSFFHIILVFLWSRRAVEIASSASCGINNDGLLRVHIPVCSSP